jgi:hypothetical protein
VIQTRNAALTFNDRLNDTLKDVKSSEIINGRIHLSETLRLISMNNEKAALKEMDAMVVNLRKHYSGDLFEINKLRLELMLLCPRLL